MGAQCMRRSGRGCGFVSGPQILPRLWLVDPGAGGHHFVRNRALLRPGEAVYERVKELVEELEMGEMVRRES